MLHVAYPLDSTCIALNSKFPVSLHYLVVAFVILYSKRPYCCRLRLPRREDWLGLSKSQGITRISHYIPPKAIASFDCHEMGSDMNCRPWKSSSEHSLASPCCESNLVHMLKTLEKALAEVGSHYEISHGTLLGALKVKGFLPWDVDGDLFVPGPIPMPFFKKGGRGRALLEEAGISGTTQRSKIICIKRNRGPTHCDYFFFQ